MELNVNAVPEAQSNDQVSLIGSRKPKNGQWTILRAPTRRELTENFTTELGCQITCVMAGTLVKLADGSVQSIESFVGGEKVMTLSGVATVKKLETTKLGLTRRIIELDSGNGDPLFITNDHPVWTMTTEGEQYWGTYNYNHYVVEKSIGAGVKFKKDAIALRFDIENKHAHVDGWKSVRPYFHDLPTHTPLYHLALDTGGSYIANDFVICSHATDADSLNVDWQGLKQEVAA
jgi:hypothetical protein